MSGRLVFDEVRNLWVKATPEEIVRQKLLQHMIRDLKFPKELISVEKELSQMPHLSQEPSPPERRADIICFAKEIDPEHPLYPLLLVECKDAILNDAAIIQALGYNHFVKAHFVALANQKEVKLVLLDSVNESYRFLPYLPSFSDLLNAVVKPNV